MAYQTRSDTLKLQRLIDILKERGSETATSLEISASDFLNDVKPKYKPGDIPHYDGTESDDGSSYVEGQSDEEDWDDEWEDCVEEPAPRSQSTILNPPLNASSPPLNIPSTSSKRSPTPSTPPPLLCKSPTPPSLLPSKQATPPKVATPPKRSPTPPLLDLVPTSKTRPKSSENKEKAADVPSTTMDIATPTLASPSFSKQSPVTPFRRESKSKMEPEIKSSYKPAVLLSGVEKSSEVASPLMKFPTLPVSIPNLFGSSSMTTTTSSISNEPKKNNKKKNSISQETLESILVESMSIATAVAVPNEPSISEVIKNGGSETETDNKSEPIKDTDNETEHDVDSKLPSESSSLDKRVSDISSSTQTKNESKEDANSKLPADSSQLHKKAIEISSPIQTKKFVNDDNIKNSPETTSSSWDERKTEKSPLRSILKKSPSTSSAVLVSDSPKFIDSESLLASETLSKSLTSLNESSVKEESEENFSSINYNDIIRQNVCESVIENAIKIENNLDSEMKKSPPKSLLTALIRQDSMEEPESASRKSPPKKHVTLKIPETPIVDSKTLKSPKSPKSPTSMNQKKPILKPQPQLQYNVPQGAKIPKVGDQRSKKPTLASQWRKQKERQKQEEQNLKERIETFAEDWPYSDNIENVPDIGKLAEAGFYYRGPNDCVQCTVCEIILKNWDTIDTTDPWIIHCKTNPGCAYLERTKGTTWIQENK